MYYTKYNKESGCNKMSCPTCGTKSCYVCGIITDTYSHFMGSSSPSEDATCPMYNTKKKNDEGNTKFNENRIKKALVELLHINKGNKKIK